MRLYVLASGSKGNLSVLESNQKHYMIDCGLPITKMKKNLWMQISILKVLIRFF